MTRDEASKIINDSFRFPHATVHDQINMFVALGMLKLEEPKSVTEKLVSAVCDDGWPRSTAETMLRFIDRAGLKLVEK